MTQVSDSTEASSTAGRSKATLLSRAYLWQMAVPLVWFGLVAGISFIEAPLKFQAPGITIPLGLGIGRLVFAVLNAAEAALLIALVAVHVWPRASRAVKKRLWLVIALTVTFVAKVGIVRPPLNSRTDLVLAGAEPGESVWHYWYIAADLVTLVLLIAVAISAGRALWAAQRQAILQASKAAAIGVDSQLK